MDFVTLFAELAKNPEFNRRIDARFQAYCVAKKIPDDVRRNHLVTWNASAQAGAEVLAEIVGEMMEKHPFLAKQAMKMLEG